MKSRNKAPKTSQSLPTAANHHYNVIQIVRRVSLWHEVNDRVNGYLERLRGQRAHA